MEYIYRNKLWFRGKGQKKSAFKRNEFVYRNRGIVISKNEKNSNSHTSTIFNNINELFEFIKISNIHDRCLYEIISDKCQLYFDIDINNNIYVTLKNVIDHIYYFLYTYFNITPKKHLILCASRHTKKSFHLIFPEFYIDSLSKRILMKNIVKHGNEYIDYRVYNLYQPFRIFGSYKPREYDSELKIIDTQNNILSINDVSEQIFKMTIISNVSHFARALSKK